MYLNYDGGDCLDGSGFWCVSEELECAASAAAQTGSPEHTLCADAVSESDCHQWTCAWCTAHTVLECDLPHEFPDCQGGCAVANSLGDGFCDPALDCDLFDRDIGDCNDA